MRSQTRRSSKSLITKDGPPLDGGPPISEMNKGCLVYKAARCLRNNTACPAQFIADARAESPSETAVLKDARHRRFVHPAG